MSDLNSRLADQEPGPTEPEQPSLANGGAPHGAGGRFQAGNQAARQHGLYSRQQSEELREYVTQLKAGIVADLGGEAALSTLERAYVDRLGDVEITLQLLAADIARRGLLTHNGGVRRVYERLLSGIDRWDRLAQRIGLARRTRHVEPLDAVRRAVEEANQP